MTSFHLSNEDLERLGTPEQAWEHLRVPGDAKPTFIVLGDPFTFNPTPTLLDMLDKLEAAYPGRPVIGGMASAAEEPGQNLLIFEGQTLRHGLVGIALWGRHLRRHGRLARVPADRGSTWSSRGRMGTSSMSWGASRRWRRCGNWC